VTFQLRVGRPVHLAHAAFTNLGSDLVAADAGTRSEGQISAIIRAGTGAACGR